jgi:hypothetical protein
MSDSDIAPAVITRRAHHGQVTAETQRTAEGMIVTTATAVCPHVTATAAAIAAALQAVHNAQAAVALGEADKAAVDAAIKNLARTTRVWSLPLLLAVSPRGLRVDLPPLLRRRPPAATEIRAAEFLLGCVRRPTRPRASMSTACSLPRPPYTTSMRRAERCRPEAFRSTTSSTWPATSLRRS